MMLLHFLFCIWLTHTHGVPSISISNSQIPAHTQVLSWAYNEYITCDGLDKLNCKKKQNAIHDRGTEMMCCPQHAAKISMSCIAGPCVALGCAIFDMNIQQKPTTPNLLEMTVYFIMFDVCAIYK